MTAEPCPHCPCAVPPAIPFVCPARARPHPRFCALCDPAHPLAAHYRPQVRLLGLTDQSDHPWSPAAPAALQGPSRGEYVHEPIVAADPATLPPPGRRIVVRCYLESWGGLGQIAERLARALMARGHEVVFWPISLDVTYGALADWVRPRIVVDPPDEWVLQLEVPRGQPPPGKQVVRLVMWETTRVPDEAVARLNSCAAVIVPCAANAAWLSAQGVQPHRPITVAPLGVDPTEGFRPTGPYPTADPVFRVGMAGCGRSGTTRKNFAAGIRAFVAALGDRPDAELEVKVFEHCAVDADGHPRVRINRTPMTPPEMADWTRGRHVLFVPSRGEGWGLHSHQALAVGRPLIAALWGGTAEFADRSVCLPLEYRLEPAAGDFYHGLGHWAVPTHASMVRQLRWAYSHRSELAAMGERAAARAAEYTWDRTACAVLAVLSEVGMIGKPRVALGTPVPR
jgi:glycosyltransferase involved in cell wall biosynthesis